MRREFITWHEVAEQLPDDEFTVLVNAPSLDEPVWLGFYDDGAWCSVDGAEIEGVERWAHMPTGEANA